MPTRSLSDVVDWKSSRQTSVGLGGLGENTRISRDFSKTARWRSQAVAVFEIDISDMIVTSGPGAWEATARRSLP
jgi:hypothetical protein